jgi:hypothetical protein
MGHDGFTLNDLVSYDRKHNEANTEVNRDGADDNRSWNCGVEGPWRTCGLHRLLGIGRDYDSDLVMGPLRGRAPRTVGRLVTDRRIAATVTAREFAKQGVRRWRSRRPTAT